MTECPTCGTFMDGLTEDEYTEDDLFRSFERALLKLKEKLFQLFIPTQEELDKHKIEGYCRVYWGLQPWSNDYKTSPLRQNIILFMAAMNNEL